MTTSVSARSDVGVGKNARKCRVVYVVHSLGVGGIERCVARLASRLPRDRFTAAIVSLTSLGEATKWIERDDVELVGLDWKGGNNLRKVTSLSRVFKDLRADVVHSHNWGTLLETSIGRRLANVAQHFHTEHGQDSQENVARWKRFVRGRLSRLAYHAATEVFVCAETNRERVSRRTAYGAERLRYIPNGVQQPKSCSGDRLRLRSFLGISESAQVVGSVARLVPVKNFVSAVAAMAEMVQRGRDAHLVLVGDGPERSSLLDVSRKMGIEARVHLVGEQTSVGRWLSTFDIYLNCSLSEALSMGILEAMASGLPIVATDVGDNRNVVSGTPAAGIIVPADCADELRRALEQILDSRELACQFRNAAVARYRQDFTEDRFVERHVCAYEQGLVEITRG